MVGKREEPKPSNAKSNINSAIAMSVVPSLTLIDKSQSPPRKFDRGELLGTGRDAERIFECIDISMYYRKGFSKCYFRVIRELP